MFTGLWLEKSGFRLAKMRPQRPRHPMAPNQAEDPTDSFRTREMKRSSTNRDCTMENKMRFGVITKAFGQEYGM